MLLLEVFLHGCCLLVVFQGDAGDHGLGYAKLREAHFPIDPQFPPHILNVVIGLVKEDLEHVCLPMENEHNLAEPKLVRVVRPLIYLKSGVLFESLKCRGSISI